MPMSVGDDYFYTFVYNGQSMLEPLPLDVKKVSSLYDLFGYHVLEHHLSENENDWENVTFARYYGIGGIRIEKSKE